MVQMCFWPLFLFERQTYIEGKTKKNLYYMFSSIEQVCWWVFLLFEFQTQPTTPSRSRSDAFSPNTDVNVLNSRELSTTPKFSTLKRTSTKQENIRENCPFSETLIPWSSLPANLAKPGKVYLFLRVLLYYCSKWKRKSLFKIKWF